MCSVTSSLLLILFRPIMLAIGLHRDRTQLDPEVDGRVQQRHRSLQGPRRPSASAPSFSHSLRHLSTPAASAAPDCSSSSQPYEVAAAVPTASATSCRLPRHSGWVPISAVLRRCGWDPHEREGASSPFLRHWCWLGLVCGRIFLGFNSVVCWSFHSAICCSRL